MKTLSNVSTYNRNADIILRITSKCNEKCLFCFVKLGKNHKKLETIKKEIDRTCKTYKNANIKFIISGGEPTLHPDFLNIVDYIFSKDKNNNIALQLETNATMFGVEKITNHLKKYGEKISFFISFHSHIEQLYNLITQTKGIYKLAINGINKIIENFPKSNITINIVLNSLNINFIEKHYLFIAENFYTKNNNIHLNFSVMTNMERYSYADKLLIKYSKIVDILNSLGKLHNKYPIQITSPFGGPCGMPYCIGKNLFCFNDIRKIKHKKIEERIKFETCKSCKYDECCVGILKKYVEKYGNGEIIAIKN
ncbi:MAG: radical SAM protein [Candidatus Gracilibacteria bacterium]|nr:radical SAM protein [Candidatus Gracilibacteria bacterium]